MKLSDIMESPDWRHHWHLTYLADVEPRERYAVLRWGKFAFAFGRTPLQAARNAVKAAKLLPVGVDEVSP